MGLLNKLREFLFAKQAPGQMSVVSELSHTAWSNRDYHAFAEQAYQKCVIAYRSINLIARGLGSIPLYVLDGDDEVDDDHELVKLLSRPNPRCGGGSFFETMTGFYLIAGNSYVLRVPHQGSQAMQPPKELYVLRPDQMRVEVANNGISHYIYGSAPNQHAYRPVVIDGQVRHTILHLRTFNPTDSIYGLSPVEAAAFAVDQHNAAGEWNYRLLKNGAKPSGIMTRDAKYGELTPQQYERVKKMINERFASQKNAGKPMLLEGGLDWKQMGLTPSDMDWINGKNVSAREVATTFGVPPMLVGIVGDATYANYKEARLALWEETILPLAYYVRDELNAWLAPWYGPGVHIKINEDAIPALIEKRMAMFKEVETVSFITPNEKRELTGFDEIDGGDVLLVSAMMVPLSSVASEDDEEPAPPANPSDEEEEIADEIEEVEDDVDKAAEVGYGRRQ